MSALSHARGAQANFSADEIDEKRRAT